MTKVILRSLCYFYGIFPGNDVIITELSKYCSLIGYCYGGRKIYKVELWEALFERNSRFCRVWLYLACLMAEKRLCSRWFSTNGLQTNGSLLLSSTIAAMTKGGLSDGHCARVYRTKNYMRHYYDCTSRLFSDGRCRISNHSRQISCFTVCYHLLCHLAISF